MKMQDVMAARSGGSVLMTSDVVSMLANDGGSGNSATSRRADPSSRAEPKVGLG